METSVITLYDELQGNLTPETLNRLMQPYVNTDIDHGGKYGLKSFDGLEVEEIIAKVMKPKQYADHLARRDTAAWWNWIDEMWYDITRKHWKFW